MYIDLAIGLVLAFLFLSLMVSGANEALVRLFGIRSKFLWAYLRDTLDGARGDGRSWVPAKVTDVFARLPFSGADPRPHHEAEPAPPVVEPVPADVAPDAVSVSGPTPADPVPTDPVPTDPVPTDLASAGPTPATGAAPAGTTSAADAVSVGVPAFTGDPVSAADPAPAPRVDMTERLYERLREIDHPKGARTSISDIPPERFSGAVMELVAAEEGGVEGLLAKLEAIGSPLAGHLRGVWESAQRDLGRFRKGVENWFDGEMERLSGLYRRYVKWVIFVLALALTLVFGMDSLEYGKTLLRDNAYRAGVAAIAGGGGEGLAALREKCAVSGTAEPYDCVTEAFSSPALVKIFDHSLVSVTIPPDGERDPSFNWNGASWWDRLISPGHWPGYLITVVALLFGASFWWDVLRRLTGLRNRRSG
ncbi:hypothetical protein [Streptosporangium sandarakinum]|uniref:Uncharacterized protein n=1 Tax=Streptosporangium sandarakinum TaxID=1260955 RepID=A0A852UYL9_9ACTN|nr:hypothetical protein [Streptosporangium sandarakinum]NYF38901.1 hypothetical protein [Streptosporangium sandarakinum]